MADSRMTGRITRLIDDQQRGTIAGEDGIDYATKKGVFVVTTTRAGAGRIAARGGRGRGGATEPTPDETRRRIAGEDLAPVKARVLLMLALARTSDPAEIQRMFTEY